LLKKDVDAYKDAGRDPERQAYQEKARHPNIWISAVASIGDLEMYERGGVGPPANL